MKNGWKRLASALLAGALSVSLAVPAWAEEPAATERSAAEESAQPFSITVGDYVPDMAGHENIQAGGTYTLIALPVSVAKNGGDADVSTLTPAELLSAAGQAMYIGSAVAERDGYVAFRNVRLRTADAVVYYVTGPNLPTPLYESTNDFTSAVGSIVTDSADHSATITLVDAKTGYAYANAAQADGDGDYFFEQMAPGTYNLRVTKPGYLPTDRAAVEIPDSKETILAPLDLSSGVKGLFRVGDVTGDGARNMDDLAALLLYFGRPDAVPADYTADLNGDGAVDKLDSDLLLTAAAKPDPKDITTGTATNVTGAKLTARDSGAAADASQRYLSIGVDTTATVTAAAFSLTFPLDAVQPLNAKGGLISPVDGSGVASCLVPTSGVEARLVRWQVAGGYATLSFALTCAAPKAAGELAKFYYRPVSGSTNRFYDGVFALDQAAGVVGKDTVVTQYELTYPGQDSAVITSLSIDQVDATLTIPAAGHTAVLALTATGVDQDGTEYPDLTGIVWTVADESGQAPDWASVDGGLLTVTDAAVPGDITVIAARGDVVSAPLTVTLENEAPRADTLVVEPVGDAAALTVVAGASGQLTFSATVYDQYGGEMEATEGITWSLSGHPDGVSVDEDGILTADCATLAANPGGYRFTLHAQALGLSQGVLVTLVVEPQLGQLVIAGPDSAIIPDKESVDTELEYTVAALDKQGNPMELSADDISGFSVTPADQGVEAGKGLDGRFTVTVSPAAQTGEYTITAVQGDVEGSYTLTLTQAPDYTAIRAHLEAEGGGAYTAVDGEGLTVALQAVLLDADGDISTSQPEAWDWSVSPELTGVELTPGSDGAATLELLDSVQPGQYRFAVTAADSTSGLSVTLPITVEVQSALASLELTAPESLAIPETGAAEHALAVNGYDRLHSAVSNLEDLVWRVTDKATGQEAVGVEVQAQTRRLVIRSTAVPGEVTIQVSSADGSVTASADVKLTPAGTSTGFLTLYQSVTLDTQSLAEQEAHHTETFTLKEGQTLRVSYTAMLVDQTTGSATPVPAGDVKWLGAGNAFEVDENAESGVYTGKVTAVYQGQSASATVTATLYPNITGLALDFGGGADRPPYILAVPSKGSRLYPATVMAQIVRSGVEQTVPIASLGLADYDIQLFTALTGLYAELDREKGILNFTVDPAAIQNPTAPPTDGTSDIRFIELYLDYFPDETLCSESMDLYLEPETARAASAMLRRGTGTGVSFAFGTPRPGEGTTAAAGTLSNCYALELLDQYGSPISGQVTWSLTGPAEVVSPTGGRVSIVEPGEAIEQAYPSYASIRRLRIAPDCPEGHYELTLTAKSGDMTCVLPIDLTVTGPITAQDLTMSLSGEGRVIIPMYYAQYNSATVNTKANTTEYTAILKTAFGGELDLMEGYSLTWTVTDPSGKTPAGVSIAATRGTASATVSVARTAQPTGVADASKHTVTATLRDAQGTVFAEASALLELNRSASVPTLMSLRKRGETTNVTSASFAMAADATETKTQDYTFHLLDQYNDLAALKFRKEVKWSLTNADRSGVTLQVLKDSEGVPYARITVANPGYSVNKTVTLTASITIVEEKAPSGRQTISYALPMRITIGSSGGGGGGGGGGGLGDDTGGAPARIAINGNTSVTTTQGKATTASYSATLRDASGKTCASSYNSSVTWSSTIPAGSGITFNSSTHVLTVPNTVKAGTYTVTLTAKYGTRLTATRTVTVTVSASSGTPAKLTIGGNTSIAATQGTAASYTYTANLTDAAGTACPATEVSKVTWSVTGAASGITFNTTTRTLSVPATVPVGTYQVILTAKYAPTNLSASATVNITVSSKQTAAVAGPTIVPTMTATGTAGSVSLNATQEKAMTDYTAAGGTITLAPTGPTNLTSATVNVTSATVKTMAGRNQSLKVQTSLGTVVLPAQALTALTGQGGNNVSVTVAADHGVVKVTFACGYESASLPGSIALRVPTTGNVAVRTLSDGSKDVIKKAVVRDGAVVAYVSGTTQLELETRQPTFSDTQSHWAKDAISFTAARELFNGTSATTFSPNATMTRSMLVTVLHRLEDTPAAEAASFADVPAGQWYTTAVDWANAKGIVQGTGTGFAPDGSITREQLATILYRYVGSLGLSTGQKGSLSAFSDQGRVSTWAQDAVQWAVGTGLINGKSDGRLDPAGNATRAEVSTILQRLISNVLVPAV